MVPLDKSGHTDMAEDGRFCYQPLEYEILNLEDGRFWMSAEDFLKHFTKIYMCLVPVGWWTRHRQGEWSLKGNGTCGP